MKALAFACLCRVCSLQHQPTMRLKRYLVALASWGTLSLSIISTTFVFLALSSNKWSIQKYHDASIGGGSPTTWTDPPLCAANRSPFYRCGIPVVTFDAVKNITTCQIPDCAFYKPYGWNQTSCRLPVETGSEDDPLNGTEQECQEGKIRCKFRQTGTDKSMIVHYAGALQIAACFFEAFSLCLLLPLTTFNLISSFFSTSHHTQRHEQEMAESSTRAETPSNHAFPKSTSERLSPWTPYIVLVLLFSLYVGAILQILAQFFGVLGLTLNATPTPAQATQNGSDDFGASYWVMDKALTTFATVAWTSSLACGMMTGFVYRTPKFSKLI